LSTLIQHLEEEALREAQQVALEVARRFAATVDRENRFPTEAVDALRSAGLLALLVPKSLNGIGGRFADACEVAIMLGRECVSTALIWAMHSQQVAIMADHACDQWRDALDDVAARGALIASATSEPEKGGNLMLARAALQLEGDRLHVDRPSPVVSYGAEADYYLVTMRRSPARPETDVCFVLLSRGDGRVTGGWNAMGMRGTRSVSMHFEADVPPQRVLATDFRHIVTSTAIPAAHLAWTSAWYGAARGALDRFVTLLRNDAQERRRFASDLFCSRLADTRLSLDLLESMLRSLMQRYESMRAENAPQAAYEEPAWTIALNGLKVAGSRISYSTVDLLIELAGLTHGYLADEVLGLERVFRDLRSATLMVNNDHLLQMNAKQMLMHQTGES
jgi:acyl-CoA dehydrogenase